MPDDAMPERDGSSGGDQEHVVTPLTATTSMARRIDMTELGLVQAVAERARALGNADVRIMPVGGVAATLAESGSPFNKLIGLGLGSGQVNEADLGAIERVHAARGVPLQVELSTLADPAVGVLLTSRGYLLEGFENVLGLALADALPRAADGTIDVRAVGQGEDTAWVDTVITAFLHEDQYDGPPAHESFEGTVLRRAFEACSGVPGFSRYWATRAGVDAGGASLYVSNGIALLAGAATLPAWRRKGVQATLLASRLRTARDLGCDLAVVTTQPGSKSQVNVQRAGFQLLYARAILRKT